MITITSKKIPDRPNNPAMIPVRNEIVHQILTYLKRQASNGDTEAETLHTELLADQTNTTYKDLLKTERTVNPHRTPGGAYIID
jgi:hypothetical protein